MPSDSPPTGPRYLMRCVVAFGIDAKDEMPDVTQYYCSGACPTGVKATRWAFAVDIHAYMAVCDTCFNTIIEAAKLDMDERQNAPTTDTSQ